MAATEEQQQGHPGAMTGTFSFTDKVVVVTGAARGLGRVTALGFARAGAKVVISDTDDPGGEETLRLLQCEGGEGLYMHTDVRSESQVQAMIEKIVEKYGQLPWTVGPTLPEGISRLIMCSTAELMIIAAWRLPQAQ